MSIIYKTSTVVGIILALLVAYYASFANTIYQSLLSVAEMFYVSLLTITMKSQKKNTSERTVSFATP